MSDFELKVALAVCALLLLLTLCAMVWQYMPSIKIYRKLRGGHWIYRSRWQRVTGDAYLYHTNRNPHLGAEDYERH